MLEVHGGVKTECAVEPLSVVKDFDVVEDRAFRLGAGGVDLPVDEFGFQRRPEALHPGVVVAVARPAHARDRTVGAQQFPVGVAGVLAAAIRVVEQPGRGPMRLDRPLEGTGDQRGGHRVVRCPAHDLAAARVEHTRDVEPTLLGGNVSDVRLPHLAGPGGWLHSLGQVVRGDGAEMAAVGRAWPEAPLLPGTQPSAAHEPRHPVTATHFARAPQRDRQSGTAVGAPARFEELAGLCAEVCVLSGAWAFAFFLRGVVRTARHAERAAELSHRMCSRELFDHRHL